MIPRHLSSAAVLALAITSAAHAQPFAISWYTIDGGGGTSTGGGFTLSGTIGQPDAGVMTGGGFTLQGGFWPGAIGVPAGCSIADIVAIGGTPPADGILTGDDFNAFIGAFAASDPLSDIVSIGGTPPGDGLITGDDFIAFIGAFAAGCP
ncbi:MAG: hypothetical protein LW650_08755 [Planctomycetaceae bacterium]|jgi:hypothetical protein|nr:hypothetical protein [Phycisphaerales bacterium]MCE2653570.1 hypothetical protein [Planctomycetaceae bacterium]